MPFDFTTRRFISPTNQEGGQVTNFTNITIPPSVINQVVLPPEGYNGFNEVTVLPVTASIDQNITRGNIMNGVSVLNITGIASKLDVSKYGANLDMFFGNTINGIYEAPQISSIDYNFSNIKYIPDDGFSYTKDLFKYANTINFCNTISCGNNCFYDAFRNSFATSIDFSNLSIINTNSFINAFNGCVNLTNLSFNRLETVGANAFDWAFYNCKNLVNFTLPSIKNVGNGAFWYAFDNAGVDSFPFVNCTDISNSMLYGAFYNCQNLTTINVQSIENCGTNGLHTTFSHTNITGKVEFSNLVNVGYGSLDGIFSNCQHLNEVEFSRLSSIKDQSVFYQSFYNCQNLVSVSFPNLISGIASTGYQTFGYTFYNCVNLINVDFSNLHTIQQRYFYCAFCNCRSLEEVQFPNLTYATHQNCFDSAFCNCTSLKTFNVHSFSHPWGFAFFNAFNGCTNLVNTDFYGVVNAGNGCFKNAFWNCRSLKDLSFDSVMNITTTSFDGMLSYCNDCVVHFPKNLENTMGTWSSVLSGFNGVNTTVLFDLPSISNDFNGFYNILDNGVLGGDDFAIDASSNSNYAYLAITSDNSTGWQSESTTEPHFITLYCPDGGMAANYIYLNTHNTVNMTTNLPVIINLCTSEDGNNWNEVQNINIGSSTSGSYRWTRVIQRNGNDVVPNMFHKYYRIYFNSYNNDPSYQVTINRIRISGAQRKQ